MLNIEPKENHPDTLESVQEIPSKYYFTAEELMLVVNYINQLGIEKVLAVANTITNGLQLTFQQADNTTIQDHLGFKVIDQQLGVETNLEAVGLNYYNGNFYIKVRFQNPTEQREIVYPNDSGTVALEKYVDNRVNEIYSIIGDGNPDADTIINKVVEMLSVFATYPESVNIFDLLNGKVNVSDNTLLLAEKEKSFINSGATLLIPQRGQANYTYIGIAPASTLHVGITGRNISPTNYFSMQNRAGYVTTSVAGNVALMRQAADGICLSQNFDSAIMFGISQYVSGQRSFIGYTADGTFTPGNTEPTTLLNCCGLAQLSTSNNWHIIHNDGTGTANPIDLGVNFPSNTSSTDVYAAYFTKITGGVNVKVNRISEAGNVVNTASYNITSDLPSSTAILYYRWHTTNNATAAVCSMDIFRLKNGN